MSALITVPFMFLGSWRTWKQENRSLKWEKSYWSIYILLNLLISGLNFGLTSRILTTQHQKPLIPLVWPNFCPKKLRGLYAILEKNHAKDTATVCIGAALTTVSRNCQKHQKINTIKLKKTDTSFDSKMTPTMIFDMFTRKFFCSKLISCCLIICINKI